MDGGGAVGLSDAQGRNGTVRRHDSAWRKTPVIGKGAYTTTTQLAKGQHAREPLAAAPPALDIIKRNIGKSSNRIKFKRAGWDKHLHCYDVIDVSVQDYSRS